MLQRDKCVALGEIGLDYYYDLSPRDVQKKVLAEQMQLAIEMDMKVAEDMLIGMDFGEGSVKALVAEDGREVVFIQEAEGEEAKEEATEAEEAVEEAKVWFVGNEFYETSKQSE